MLSEPVVTYDRPLLLITLCEHARQKCQAQVLADPGKECCCLCDKQSD